MVGIDNGDRVPGDIFKVRENDGGSGFGVILNSKEALVVHDIQDEERLGNYEIIDYTKVQLYKIENSDSLPLTLRVFFQTAIFLNNHYGKQ